jgi:hypothetical protein
MTNTARIDIAIFLVASVLWRRFPLSLAHAKAKGNFQSMPQHQGFIR